MTSIPSTLGNAGGLTNSPLSLDTNGDGVVSPEELKAAGVSSKRSGDTTVKSDDGVSGIAAQIASELITALLSKSASETTGDASERKAQSEKEIFAALDKDGDGKVTRAEFIAGRPVHVSEEDAAMLFATFDSAGTGSLTETQFAAALEANRPDHPAASFALTDDSADTVSLTELLDEMTAIIDRYRHFAADSDDSDGSSVKL